MARGFNRGHHGPIGGGFGVGEDSGEHRRRRRGNGCSNLGEEEGGARQLALVAALGSPREEVHCFGWL
jgi:hypothetical protein